MKIRVEFESTPVRHIAVQCPECEKWFNGREITANAIWHESDIYSAEFVCPVCNHRFDASHERVEIEEAYGSSVYDGCLKKKEVWE